MPNESLAARDPGLVRPAVAVQLARQPRLEDPLMQEEIWKPIPHAPDYLVSSHGRVKSTARVVGKRQVTERILSTRLVRGYPGVHYRVNGKKTDAYVHRLMAEAFLPDWEPWKTVNHIDGDMLNNNIANLECLSTRANTQHAVTVGRIKSGEQSHMAKLTESNVQEIIRLLETTTTRYEDIGRMFGVSRPAIRHINDGRSWAEEGRKYPIRTRQHSGSRNIYDSSTKAYVVAMVNHTENASQVARAFQIPLQYIHSLCRLAKRRAV